MFTYHCTVLHGLNGESWSLVGNAQAGSFTFLTFNFVLWRIFSRSQCSNTHTKVNTGRQFLAECVEKKLGAPRVFPFFFLFSFLFVSYVFWTGFLGLFSGVERDPEEAEFWALGWSLRLHFHCLTHCRPAALCSHRQVIRSSKSNFPQGFSK